MSGVFMWTHCRAQWPQCTPDAVREAACARAFYVYNPIGRAEVP